MLPWMAQKLLSWKAHPYIDSMPIELVEMIIREYAIVSITLGRASPMSFLLVCPLWTLVGEARQHLFRQDHLVVSGHDEVAELLAVYRGHTFPSNITNLTVNLTPVYAGEALGESSGLISAMAQVQEDINGLRTMFHDDWRVTDKPDIVFRGWSTLKLEHFSLSVNLTNISAQKTLLRSWIRSWILRMEKWWSAKEWNGSGGFYDGGIYSYWDR